MRRLRPILAAVAVLTAAALAGPAAAMSGDCLWKNLPAAKRAELVESYRSIGLDALSKAQFADSDFELLSRKCQITSDTAVKAGEVIGAVLLETGADLMLKQDYDIRPGTLDKQWKALAESDREAVRSYAVDAMANKPAPIDGFAAVMAKVQQAIGLEGDGPQKHVLAFILGRGLREAREAGR